MSVIERLSVQNIRSHESYSLSLSPGTTVITGNNGAGKTSLIEAIYISLQGSSFRATDKDVIRHGAEWYRIDSTLGGSHRTVKYQPSKASGRKQYTINDKIYYRLPSTVKYPIVLFEPEDLRLLNGSPARRRLFIDRFISQIDSDYIAALRKYERALKQRNNLLKHSRSQDDFFVWNVALSEYGAYIIKERIAFIERINLLLTEKYQSIANTDDIIGVHYSHTLVDNIQQKILTELSKNFQKDSLLGYTTSGPHRDDVLFTYNSQPADIVASRGENRTIVLALKLIEAQLIQDVTGCKPIVLLDDVYSELDESRQKNISELAYQTVITSTTPLNKTFFTVDLVKNIQ